MDIEKLAVFIDGLLRSGDAVLIKGSRGMRMERIMAILEQRRGAARRRIG